MNRRNILSLSTIAALGLTTLPGISLAQTAKDLVGTWELVSNVNTAPDGTKSDTWGPHGTGIGIFESNGHFAIIDINPDISKIASNNPRKATAEEAEAIVAGTNAFYGTYSVTGKEITLKVDESSNPNQTGKEQKRILESYNDTEFRWVIPAPALGGKSETVWHRMK